ncbi:MULTISPECIES: murein L,D-transpeptidase family protein [unclassified Methylobacterium]|uniref:L,D-transpeptidase family protein n=1 Tax=unclassified Methylobacterium TaxID=2615210 RepID=UPI0011C1E55F|nr:MULTISPECIES: murein L,D-transpeptidase family protein [unclassified Methylobacterium]QEE39290.1 murein L,D-transpeptidase [Methylobacterium sp. WL1]TXN55436.1 murein L,D-transpeptidase [Methylobacterium sp. WL2]
MTARLATARLLAAASLLALALAGCQDGSGINGPSARSIAPIAPQTVALMQTKGMQQTDPILIRAYKKEAEMEVWKRGGDGRYALLKTYPICRWSGQLGPKVREGDRQAPEGFYTITPGLMNPNSSYYLSFDTGFPNAVDRANGRTGKYLMVHGTCSSAGCFAMTDATIAEIYAVAREAFIGGQRSFQFQSYPFRMTAQNMAKFRNDPNMPFWQNLKEGSDYFEALREEPKVGQCGTKYVFGGSDAAAGACKPRLDPVVAEKREHDEREVAELVAKGTPAVRVVYQDGGQNPVFRPQNNSSAFASLGGTETVLPYDAKEFGRHNLGDVSRPETLAAGPQEIEIGPKVQPTMMAGAEPAKAATKAATKAGRGQNPVATTLMANRTDPDLRVETTASVGEKPARITVADADGDPSSYQKLMGSLFSKEKPAAPATPAVDAAVVPEPVKLAHDADKLAPKATAKPHAVKTAKVEGKVEGKVDAKAAASPKLVLRKGEPDVKAKP